MTRILLLAAILSAPGMAQLTSTKARTLAGKPVCTATVTTNCISNVSAGGTVYGGGGGTSVNVNGSEVTSPNLNGSTPAASAGYTNVAFQVSSSSVSAQIRTAYPADLGALTWSDTGTLTFAAASNAVAGASITTTASQSMTLSPTNLVKWGTYSLEIINAAGTAATLTLGTAGACSAWKVAGSGGGAITLTGGSAIDFLSFTFDGTNCVAWFANSHT